MIHFAHKQPRRIPPKMSTDNIGFPLNIFFAKDIFAKKMFSENVFSEDVFAEIFFTKSFFTETAFAEDIYISYISGELSCSPLLHAPTISKERSVMILSPPTFLLPHLPSSADQYAHL